MAIKMDYKVFAALIGMLLLAIAAWFLADTLRYKTYALNAASNSISSLRNNSPVQFNGIVVGKVSQIRFDEKDPRKISLLIRVKKNTPITQGTIVSLRYRGYVKLTDEGIDLNPLIAEDDAQYPVISDANQSPDDILNISHDMSIVTLSDSVKESASEDVTPMSNDPAKINEIKVQSIVQISKSLQKTNKLFEQLITADNAESLKQILYSLQQLSGVLAANSEKLNDLLVNSADASNQFKPLLVSGNATVQMLRTQTLPEAHQLVLNVNDTLNLLRELAATIKQNPTVFIRGAPKPNLGPGETLQYSDKSLQ